MITCMPYWAERVGTPRTLAVEFPFGHVLGFPGDQTLQRKILHEALNALATIQTPGTVLHSEQRWPQSTEEAMKRWQPVEPSPIIAELTPKFREMLRKQRKA
jgi:hypothetical protein